ncbi:MAG: type II toxin-antitoxin system PemK/MazF family toxin [Sporichthyaceae bacterium]
MGTLGRIKGWLNQAMMRGEIYLTDFEPALGPEPNKTRPAVIVSNDGNNERAELLGRGLISVVPLTSNVDRVMSFQLFLPAETTGLRLDSRAQVEQIRGLSMDRIGARVGQVPIEYMFALDAKLRMFLVL